MTTLIIATRNAHKAAEFRALCGGGERILTLNDLSGAPPLREEASTFAGNAVQKAEQLAGWLLRQPGRLPEGAESARFVLADDSGLEVEALGGDPGVRSARFAAGDSGTTGNSSDAANNAKLLRLLEGVPLDGRRARFRCLLALIELPERPPWPAPLLFEGQCEGHIQFAAAGGGGFGYDPLFVPVGYHQSFAELGELIKNHLSHRAQALRLLQSWWAKARS